MRKILSHLIILLLIFSCSQAENKSEKDENATETSSLDYQSFIPDLSGKMDEISGLIIFDDLFWGFNDSGGQDELYGFDASGKIQKTIEIGDAKNKDWESITQDDTHIYIGDFGNNMGNRNNLRIFKIKKEDIDKDEEQKIEAKEISFAYSNQDDFSFLNNTTPFDCEAMAEFKGYLYIFSKNWKEFTTTVYKIPTDAGNYIIDPIDTFNIKGLITGADISPDSTQLALVGYQAFQSFMWLFSDFSDDDFFNGDRKYFTLNNLLNCQTEGICFNGNDSVLVSCEKTSTFSQQVFLFKLD